MPAGSVPTANCPQCGLGYDDESGLAKVGGNWRCPRCRTRIDSDDLPPVEGEGGDT